MHKEALSPQQIEEIVLGEGGDGGGGFGEGAGAGAGFVGKQGSVGELAGELALSMLKLQDTFFDGVLGHHLIHVDVFGLADTMCSVGGLILCGGLPVFNLILIINFFRSLPDSLEEAAVVDGAGPWRILFSIVVPCSVPVLATIILFTGVGYWNEFFQGMVLSSSDSSYPLQAYIQQMVVTTQINHMSPDQLKLYSQMSNKSLNAAKVFIAMVPMMCVYPFLQRYFVTVVLPSAVKG